MSRGLALAICFILLAAYFFTAFAQTNSTEYLTITTYYPSPYGVYGTLKLHPKSKPAEPCREGEMFYNLDPPQGLHVCNHTLGWQKVPMKLDCAQAYRLSTSSNVVVYSGNTSAVASFDNGGIWGLSCVPDYQKTGCFFAADWSSGSEGAGDSDLIPAVNPYASDPNTCLSDDEEKALTSAISIVCCRVQ